MTPFLDSTSMFSLMHDKYEKDLMEEIWACHKYMKLSMEEVYRMPRSDRKAFIKIHNNMINEESKR